MCSSQKTVTYCRIQCLPAENSFSTIFSPPPPPPPPVVKHSFSADDSEYELSQLWLPVEHSVFSAENSDFLQNKVSLLKYCFSSQNTMSKISHRRIHGLCRRIPCPLIEIQNYVFSAEYNVSLQNSVWTLNYEFNVSLQNTLSFCRTGCLLCRVQLFSAE